VLSPAGRKVADRAMALHASTERRLVGALTTGERAELAGLLRKLLLSVDLPATEEVP
jgi:hypothetical protein